MISRDLEIVLHRCFVTAREARHEFITVDHLVLHLLAEPEVLEDLAARSVDVDQLRSDIEARIAETPSAESTGDDFDTQPSLDFQRAIQDSILQLQKKNSREVTPLLVLGAIIAQDSSYSASRILGEATLFDATRKPAKPFVRTCSLCRVPNSTDALTTIPSRGVLCSDCLSAVLKAARQ